jgi:hypothetical protein
MSIDWGSLFLLVVIKGGWGMSWLVKVKMIKGHKHKEVLQAEV